MCARVTGILPPADQAAWEKEFEEFKLYPEWIMKRQVLLLLLFVFSFSLDVFFEYVVSNRKRRTEEWKNREKKKKEIRDKEKKRQNL